jgi:alanyl-tRNA synthetase
MTTATARKRWLSVCWPTISRHLIYHRDGQLPSNTDAGYVIRRILRRAVRYYYSYLEFQQPLLYQLVAVIATQFEDVFPELKQAGKFCIKSGS